MIYGAGEAGAIALREMMGGRSGHYRIAGFIDDDESKGGRRVQGYPVLHTYSGLLTLIERGAVDRVVISTRALPVTRVREPRGNLRRARRGAVAPEPADGSPGGGDAPGHAAGGETLPGDEGPASVCLRSHDRHGHCPDQMLILRPSARAFGPFA